MRGQLQRLIQELLEEEMTEFLGRARSARRSDRDNDAGYQNGYAPPRKLTLSSGTIQLRRPRVRNTEEEFESRLLPLFVNRTRKVAELIPELYLHGLSEGDFDLAVRGLLGAAGDGTGDRDPERGQEPPRGAAAQAGGDVDRALAVLAGTDTKKAEPHQARWAFSEWTDLVKRRFGDRDVLVYSQGAGQAAALVPTGNGGTLEVAAVLGMRWPPGKVVSERSLRGLRPLAKACPRA